MASISIDSRNNSISNKDIADYVAANASNPQLIAAKAAELGVGLNQIAEATGLSVQVLSDGAKQVGYDVTGGGAARFSSQRTGGVSGGGSSYSGSSSTNASSSSGSASSTKTNGAPPLSRNAISIPPLAAATVGAVVHGAGNNQIKDEDIRAWMAAEPRTPEQVLAAMVQYGVSAAQIGKALGKTPEQTEEMVAEYGLDEETLAYREVEHYIEVQPEEAEAVFETVHGAGNTAIANEDIKAWFDAAPRSAREVLDAMMKYGVSINQAGRALNLTTDQIDGIVKEYGVGLSRLAVTMTEGWTEEDFQDYIKNHPEKVDEIPGSSSLLGKAITSTNTLLDEARSAEDIAAADKATYDALNAKFAPAFATYNGYAQEIANLEAVIQTEQSQKAEAENALANLGTVSTKRDAQATQKREAEYQITNAGQNISDAQNRINYLRDQMAGMESWGIPLMQETEAAKAKWEQSAQVATQKNEIAGAQGNLAQQAADKNKADVSAVIFSGQALNLWLTEHPSLEGVDQVNGLLKETVPVLEQTMTEQRGWLDASRERGLNLEIDALGLEAKSTEVKSVLDKVQPARLQAEALIADKQTVYDAAVAAENKLQADLDAAYVQRDQANNGAGKGERNRLRDTANRLITDLSAMLVDATQKRSTAEAEFNQAKEAGAFAISVGVQAESDWQATLATSGNARNQSLSELAMGAQVFDVESNTTGALAAVYAQMIDTSKLESTLATGMASVGAIGMEELAVIEDKAQDNVQFALGGLTKLQQTAANDRIEAENESQRLVPLQALAYGNQLIADDKLNDANYLQSVYSEVTGIADGRENYVRANVAAAEERLNKAKLALSNADMHMDWAEARSLKNQGKAMDAARPALEAAQKELAEAQQDYDIAVAQLNESKYQHPPLRNLVIDSGWAATSAYIDADTASTQAATQSGWTTIAQKRYFNVDNIVASAQALIVQDTTELSEVQAEMADQATDPAEAELLGMQSGWNAQWASEFRDLSMSTRNAEYQTYNDQRTLDDLTVRAGGVKALGTYLGGRTEQLKGVYEAAKGVLPGLEATWQASSQQAQTDTEAAETSRNGMTDAELQSMVNFILSRNQKGTLAKNGQPSRDPAITVASFNGQALETLANNAFSQHAYQLLATEASNNGVDPSTITDEQIQQTVAQLRTQENHGVNTTFTDEQIHRTAMQLFVDKAQQDAMAKRLTMRKQLHYVDDRQVWIDADPVVQAARAGALQLAKTAEGSTQTAINHGEELQAATVVASVQGVLLSDVATRWADSTAVAVDIAAQAATQADRVVEDYNIEKAAQDNMLAGMTQYLNGNMQLAQYMHDYAQVAEDPAVGQRLGNQVRGLEKVTQAYDPVLRNTDALSRLAGESAVAAVAQAEALETAAADLKVVADDVAAKVETIKTMAETDSTAFTELFQKTSEAMAKVYGFHDWSVAAVREHADKAKDAKELHQDRVTADKVHKKEKKKGLLKMIGAAIISTVMTVASLGALGPEAGMFMMATMAAVASAASQGINMALGLQDKFSVMGVATSALSMGMYGGALRYGARFLQAIGGTATKVGNSFSSQLVSGARTLVGELALGATTDLAVQGALKVTGLKKDGIDWASVASMAMTVGGLGLLKRYSGFYGTPASATGSQAQIDMKTFIGEVTTSAKNFFSPSNWFNFKGVFD